MDDCLPLTDEEIRRAKELGIVLGSNNPASLVRDDCDWAEGILPRIKRLGLAIENDNLDHQRCLVDRTGYPVTDYIEETLESWDAELCKLEQSQLNTTQGAA
jgi:hypothetical protein